MMQPASHTPVFLRRHSAADTRDSALLARLVCDESYWVRRQAVANPSLPAETLELMVRAGATVDLRGFGHADPDLPGDDLAVLAEIGGFGAVLAARHPATPPATLDAL